MKLRLFVGLGVILATIAVSILIILIVLIIKLVQWIITK